MMRVKVDGVRGLPYHYPSNVSVVTSRFEGKENCIALSRHALFAFKPPTYGIGIGSNKCSTELIRKSGEFVINWVSFGDVTLVAAAGSRSGRDVDKFSAFGIETTEPLVVGAPVLKAAYSAYECKVVNEFTVGDSTLFAGAIVAIHYDETVFGETFDMRKLDPVLWLSHEMYAKANSQIYRVDRKALTVEEVE